MELLKESDGLGIQVSGGRGSKRSPHAIVVTQVKEGGAAHSLELSLGSWFLYDRLHLDGSFSDIDARDGRLSLGDELLVINGHLLVGLSHEEAVAILRSATGMVQLVVASKQLFQEETGKPGQLREPQGCQGQAWLLLSLVASECWSWRKHCESCLPRQFTHETVGESFRDSYCLTEAMMPSAAPGPGP
ncbi:PDZ domain-containing protein 2 [Saguinus oedipus]|uniref:PDZ domain-containing protein 2 n=1 Tax=Saguinus oedipus TaxID=9490 RepID=A0ABQ9W7V9_SAGOE|nr:PDZ domain-containing protein 2 [Saguinus oedipus]